MKQSNLSFICIFLLPFLPLWLHGQNFDRWLGHGDLDDIDVQTSSDLRLPNWEAVASGDQTINGSGLDYEYMTMSRLMKQATLGAERHVVEDAVHLSLDPEAWIDQQVLEEATYMLPRIRAVRDQINILILEAGGDSTELIDRPGWQEFNYAWWNINMTNDDLLRQRIAYALSQILVISMNSDLSGMGFGTSDFYDIFIRHAFGNYRDILEEVSLHPAMGFYLSHLNNPRTIPSANIHPDENYAREIMQLFSIGLYELNPDGSHRKDNNDNDIPTYTQEHITGLAKVFTGLGFGAVVPNEWVFVPEFGLNIYVGDLTTPMYMYDLWHEPGQKVIIGDQVIPDGQSGMEDIQDALDVIFHHPNVGPFLARRLIQHFVKSNPTPGYISRVAAAFDDNGEGVRGDILAVIKAILLDPEARNCDELLQPHHGKLTEPFLRYTQFARWVDKDHIYNRLWNIGYNFMDATTQSPLSAPTVFNFFLPDYQPVGDFSSMGLFAPEFQIHNSKTGIGYINQVQLQAVWHYLMDDWLQDSPAVYVDYDRVYPLARDPEALVNYLDKNLTHGMMSQQTRSTIKTAIENIIHGEYRQERVRLATYLTLISPDYAVLR